MIIKNIYYSNKFKREFDRLPKVIAQKAIEKENLFRDNPLHPSLELHGLQGRLKGLWSIYITGKYRIIFERTKNGDILFSSVGKHDIYKSMQLKTV